CSAIQQEFVLVRVLASSWLALFPGDEVEGSDSSQILITPALQGSPTISPGIGSDTINPAPTINRQRGQRWLRGLPHAAGMPARLRLQSHPPEPPNAVSYRLSAIVQNGCEAGNCLVDFCWTRPMTSIAHALKQASKSFHCFSRQTSALQADRELGRRHSRASLQVPFIRHHIAHAEITIHNYICRFST